MLKEKSRCPGAITGIYMGVVIHSVLIKELNNPAVRPEKAICNSADLAI